MRINRAVVEHDVTLIVGPVFPHEVVGFSGGNKYLFPGVSGRELIDLSHWLGALITSAEIIGTRGITPVRALIDEAASLVPGERLAFCVVTQSGTGDLHSMAFGDPRGGVGGGRRRVRRDARPLPRRARAPRAVAAAGQVRRHVDRRQGLLQGRADRRRRRPGRASTRRTSADRQRPTRRSSRSATTAATTSSSSGTASRTCTGATSRTPRTCAAPAPGTRSTASAPRHGHARHRHPRGRSPRRSTSTTSTRRRSTPRPGPPTRTRSSCPTPARTSTACAEASQPSAIPSAALDGAGSGSRIIRNALSSPIRPARIGISSATCSASGRASVLMRRISSWTSCGWSASSSSSCGVAHHLARRPRARRRPAAARPAAAPCCRSAMSVKAIESVASMIAPANASPNDRPNEPRGRVDAGGLADPLLRDRRRACSC